MRLRYWTALVVTAGALITFGLQNSSQLREQVDQSLPGDSDQPAPVSPLSYDDETRSSAMKDLPDAAFQDELYTWSRVIGPGENLDILLLEAGLDPLTRAEVGRVIGAEYDLRRLKPGYRVALEITPEGVTRSAVLEVENGRRVHAVFGSNAIVRNVDPVLETVARAGETEISTTIFAALDQAGIPTRFATDLELIMAGTLDLRQEVGGGEHLRIVWRENRIGDRVIGEPHIDYAELNLGEDQYEVIWPHDGSNRSAIYRNGQLVLLFLQPIQGARLSSAFGLRQHPVHGGVRMHSGVDFAADEGSTVHAIQSGRVSDLGQRSGYGLMVEIEHADGVRTLYAHLSETSDAIQLGQRVASGEEIGRVGSTGTSTGSHLHYEIIVDGKPVSPLTNTTLIATPAALLKSTEGGAQLLLAEARNDLARLLQAENPGLPLEKG